MNSETLRIFCSTIIRLTELRQNECKHLCIENFAPAIFGKLIEEYSYRIQHDIPDNTGQGENANIEFKCKACGWKSYPGATIQQNKKGTKYYCPKCDAVLDANVEIKAQTLILKPKKK